MSRSNPLDEARCLGDTLSYRNVHRVIAEKIINDFAADLYWKPRASAYRKRWVASALRGYDSQEKLKGLRF